MNSRENIGLITRFRKFLNYANCKSPCTAKVWPEICKFSQGRKIWISRNFERKINNFSKFSGWNFMMERLPERKFQIGNPKTSIWISSSDQIRLRKIEHYWPIKAFYDLFKYTKCGKRFCRYISYRKPLK